MEQVPVRELQQHASAVLRRVKSGEIVGITERGTLIALLVPPSSVGGLAGLVAAGRVRKATRRLGDGPAPIDAALLTSAVLEDLRRDG